jgi:hypothetical protein
MQWLIDHWQAIAVVVLVLDQALIPIFPQVPFLVTLKNLLTGAGVKPPAQ